MNPTPSTSSTHHPLKNQMTKTTGTEMRKCTMKRKSGLLAMTLLTMAHVEVLAPMIGIVAVRSSTTMSDQTIHSPSITYSRSRDFSSYRQQT